jgi:hypothetical protein
MILKKRLGGATAGTGSAQTIGTAPSGNAIGEQRCARITDVRAINSSTTAAREFRLTAGGLWIVPAGTYLGPLETLHLRINLPLEAGDTIAQTTHADVDTEVAGEVFVIAPYGVERRFAGPIAGTGTYQTIYTAPTGTATGDPHSARLTHAHFVNTGTAPAAHGLFIGGDGPTMIANGTLLQPQEFRDYYWNVPLESADFVEVSCGTTVHATISGEEYIIGT